MRRFPGPATARASRGLSRALLVLVLAVLVGLPSSAGATTTAEKAAYAMINETRAAEGRGPLRLSERLSRIAHRHSKEMAVRGTLLHSCLSCSIDGGWRKLGENVGVGADYPSVHSELLASPSHRANLLDRKYRRVGVGLVRRRGQVWVTQIFYA